MSLTDKEIRDLQTAAKAARLGMIDTTVWAGGAHIGGALSSADIMIALYHKYLKIRPKEPLWPERDRLIVSKGHSGVGYATILGLCGYFDPELLRDFNHFKSPFGMHLDGKKVKGVDVSTGSLGHGLPISVGLAIGARHLKQPWRTYCLMGDGECNEGSVWEAAMAARHFKLANLTAFVDRNSLMIDGRTEDVMALEPFADKWRAFGWIVREIDGHSFKEIGDAIEFAQAEKSGPVVIIAKTVKGKGVDFMENNVKWHYGSMDSDLATKARRSVEKMYSHLG